jgi:Fe2+ transport system protein FeoA
MLKRWTRRSTRRTPLRCDAAPADCPGICSLMACVNGGSAVVVQVSCPAADACRLRALGVYEGARVMIVDARNGLLLDVRGSRLALGSAIAATIAVLPVAAQPQPAPAAL